jgi:hypothetical protein
MKNHMINQDLPKNTQMKIAKQFDLKEQIKKLEEELILQQQFIEQEMILNLKETRDIEVGSWVMRKNDHKKFVITKIFMGIDRRKNRNIEEKENLLFFEIARVSNDEKTTLDMISSDNWKHSSFSNNEYSTIGEKYNSNISDDFIKIAEYTEQIEIETVKLKDNSIEVQDNITLSKVFNFTYSLDGFEEQISNVIIVQTGYGSTFLYINYDKLTEKSRFTKKLLNNIQNEISQNTENILCIGVDYQDFEICIKDNKSNIDNFINNNVIEIKEEIKKRYIQSNRNNELKL